MNSLVWKGEVHDYHFKQLRPGENWHCAFYCGTIYMGQIFRMTCRSRVSWTAVPKVLTSLGPFDGFRTRMDAAEMILKVNGYRMTSHDTPTGPSHESGTIELVCQLIDDYSTYANKVGIVNWRTLKNKIIDATIMPAPTYRRLKTGEEILPGDELEQDDHTWKAANCIGDHAPDPQFTSHRQYRRRVS